jgi:hypothetical protein
MEIPMFALSFLLRKVSALAKNVWRSLKRAFAKMSEAQMQRAQIEIDRYHRMSAFVSSTGAHHD